MIRIDGLTKTLGGQPVLRGVNLHVEDREILAIVGPSGTGKSVLLRHIIGLEEPDSGAVYVLGSALAGLRGTQLMALRRRMGYVFQDSALLDSLTIRENLQLALDPAACLANPLHAWSRMSYALDLVNLDARVLDKLPGQLSGGMRKRVAVARAILNQPVILLYDEPTTGLDPRNVTAIHQLIVLAADTLGATSVMVTHDFSALEEVADRVVLLSDGVVQFAGTASEFLSRDDPAVADFLAVHRTVNTSRGSYV